MMTKEMVQLDAPNRIYIESSGGITYCAYFMRDSGLDQDRLHLMIEDNILESEDGEVIDWDTVWKEYYDD